MAMRKGKIWAVIVSILFVATSVVLFSRLLGDEVVGEFREGKYAVRVVKEGRWLSGSINYILELDGPASTARYPLFVALDFMSDADPNDYEIVALSLSPSRDLVTINFADGYTLKYPVFAGAFSRSDFNERWESVYGQK
jgi:hypothetical protein